MLFSSITHSHGSSSFPYVSLRCESAGLGDDRQSSDVRVASSAECVRECRDLGDLSNIPVVLCGADANGKYSDVAIN